MEEIKNVDDKNEVKNDVDDADDKNEIKNNVDDMNEMNEIKNVDGTDEIKTVDNMNEIENLDDINEIKTVDNMDEIENVDKIKAEDEIASEIAKRTFKGFNYEDFQDFQDLSNISDELSEIKYAYLKINELHEFYVLKFLKESNIDEYYNKFKREIKNLKSIHPNKNVIKFLGVTKDSSKKFYSIVLEYCGNKSLNEDLEDVSKKDWPYKIKMTKGLANGIKFVHAENIILCNLNSKNIIIYKNKLVITNFSSAVSLDNQMRPTIEPTIEITDKNVAYVDPTCFNSADTFSKPSDIYSLGVILWEITSGKPAFHNNYGQDIEELKPSLINGERELPIELTPVDYKELYCDAWNKDQHNRPPIKDVINCLSEIDLDLVYHNYDNTPEISYRENNYDNIPKISYKENNNDNISEISYRENNNDKISEISYRKNNNENIPEISYRNNSITKAEACLKIIEGTPRNQYLFLPEGEILVGRKKTNYIVIKDQELNKKHAKITNYDGKVEITCFDSKSKIFIYGKEFFRSHILKRHDVIKMGRNFFGKINKQYGHNAGDDVLKELSKLIQNEYVRDNNIFARYGGEEFTILFIDENVESAYEIAKKIRLSVETLTFHFEDKKEKKVNRVIVTLSMGVSGMNSSVKKFKDLLNHAEEACRKAKEYGRNRVIIWENEQISIGMYCIYQLF
ncbi:kinase-like protein [Gigaspora margarita]|uniref:Kinase-like protein n=1 Tax=Gigaspora margarita TaxID=4874 RepID=A0A8H4EI92_GIGMA|nr:kinase-like protein [Gigaspora margarita]